MKLETWLAMLRTAGRPLEAAELHTVAQQIAARAQGLMGNRALFVVSARPNGVRISAVPPSPLARRALDRAVDEHLDEARGRLAAQGRERLISG